MEPYKVLDDAIYDVAAGRVVPRKKNPTFSIVLLLAGVAIVALAYFESIQSIHHVLQLAGAVIALVGLIMLIMCIIHKGSPYLVESGERLRRVERSFDHNVIDKVIKYVSEGDFDALDALPEGETGAILAITYRCRSGRMTLAQAMEFVPHYYTPLTDIFVFAK